MKDVINVDPLIVVGLDDGEAVIELTARLEEMTGTGYGPKAFGKLLSDVIRLASTTFDWEADEMLEAIEDGLEDDDDEDDETPTEDKVH